ncbi:Cas4 exonuclease [Mycobacterium phage HanShotFirst]|uniref:exonuclease n=1 Tax=Mycobacterium phage HanShotFirst TaxID=1429904 RepID=UPI0003C94FF9|nr:exonuclease [Mycobacterium phage HanShotFirst]AHB31847.1 Cas4 exonuclease [Mycobacterium phage HanShotFirst]
MADTDNLTRNYTYEKKPRSVSQLSQFDKCPFSWKLARHERVWKRPAAWLQQGTGVHAVAEKYMLSKLAGSPLTREECYEIFKAEYADGINEATEETPNLGWWFASGPYRGADDIERRWGIGLQQVDKTLDWIDNHQSLEVWHTPDGTPGIELAIEFELDGIEIRGYIDAVLVLDGEVLVVDWKTGLKPGDDFQLAVYALALKQLYGVEITRGVYFMAKTGKPTYPYDLTDWTREKISARFHEMERKLEAGDFTPKPGASCARCDVALSCEYSMA